MKVINDRHKETNGLYFDKWILQCFSGQQLEYQKDKSILHILNVLK